MSSSDRECRGGLGFPWAACSSIFCVESDARVYSIRCIVAQLNTGRWFVFPLVYNMTCASVEIWFIRECHSYTPTHRISPYCSKLSIIIMLSVVLPVRIGPFLIDVWLTICAVSGTTVLLYDTILNFSKEGKYLWSILYGSKKVDGSARLVLSILFLTRLLMLATAGETLVRAYA